MDENTKPTETDFQDALAAEFDLPPSTDEITQPAPAPAVVAEAEPVVPPVAEVQVPPSEATTPPEGEPVTPPVVEADPNDTPIVEPDTTKFATKDDVVDALRQYNQETTGRIDRVKEATNQVIESLYPTGLDRNIYDTNGNVIKTAQDIVDRGLINDKTGEPYEYDQAASFILEAHQKMNQNIEELNGWAERVAEENISLIEGNTRVMEKWGDTLSTLSKETVEQLAETYITKQLKFDDTNSYITEMSMTPEEFYSVVLAPYAQLNETLAAKTALEATVKAQEQRSEQMERNGIPPQRGASDVQANTGDPMLDALVNELNKG